MVDDRSSPPPPGRARLPGALGVFVCLSLAVLFGRHLAGRVEAEGWEQVDPARVRLDPGVLTADPRWEAELAAALATAAPFEARDGAARDALVARVAALPFVAEVGEPRSIWPDGLDLPVRLRRHVACVRTGNLFLAVADDGVLLPGAHMAPPWFPGGFLPVIGPMDGALDLAIPGEVIAEEHHLDALSIALSLREHLDVEWRERLGRVVIDASTARGTSLEEPGARLLLEDRRAIVFGRAPRQGAPGSAPPGHKWDGVMRALACLALGEPGLDWETVDVRWVPDVDALWRDGTTGAVPAWADLQALR